MNERNEMYDSTLEDLTKIIAQYTSGLKDAIPEQADADLAKDVIQHIEHRLGR